MAIDQDALRVPEDEGSHDVKVKMSAREFANVIRILSEFSDSVRIEVDKIGIKFVTQGDLGVGEVFMKPKPFGGSAGGGDDSCIEIQVGSSSPALSLFAQERQRLSFLRFSIERHIFTQTAVCHKGRKK